MAKELNNQSSIQHQVKDILKGEAREVLSGYPRLEPFKTREEIDAYLGQHEIDCLLCGKRFKSLSAHLTKIHRLSSDDYRKRYGLPFRRGLTSSGVTEALREVRRGDSAATTVARVARLTSAQIQQAARDSAQGQRTSGLKHLTSATGREAARHVDRQIPRGIFEEVVSAMEREEVMLKDAITGRISYSAFRDNIKRFPDLFARYAAIAGKARSKAMLGNKFYNGVKSSQPTNIYGFRVARAAKRIAELEAELAELKSKA